MPEINDKSSPTKAKAAAAKASGKIVYNGFLDSWRCINASGRLMLSTGSKAAAIKAYPDYTVVEKE